MAQSPTPVPSPAWARAHQSLSVQREEEWQPHSKKATAWTVGNKSPSSVTQQPEIHLWTRGRPEGRRQLTLSHAPRLPLKQWWFWALTLQEIKTKPECQLSITDLLNSTKGEISNWTDAFLKKLLAGKKELIIQQQMLHQTFLLSLEKPVASWMDHQVKEVKEPCRECCVCLLLTQETQRGQSPSGPVPGAAGTNRGKSMGPHLLGSSRQHGNKDLIASSRRQTSTCAGLGHKNGGPEKMWSRETSKACS